MNASQGCELAWVKKRTMGLAHPIYKQRLRLRQGKREDQRLHYVCQSERHSLNKGNELSLQEEGKSPRYKWGRPLDWVRIIQASSARGNKDKLWRILWVIVTLYNKGPRYLFILSTEENIGEKTTHLVHWRDKLTPHNGTREWIKYPRLFLIKYTCATETIKPKYGCFDRNMEIYGTTGLILTCHPK